MQSRKYRDLILQQVFYFAKASLGTQGEREENLR